MILGLEGGTFPGTLMPNDSGGRASFYDDTPLIWVRTGTFVLCVVVFFNKNPAVRSGFAFFMSKE